VGTKLALAVRLEDHQTIGIDLVAMCVNDIVVTGAEPLFFLDYYASGRLDVDTACTVVAGIAEGCRQAGAALVGGETAEMPGMYQGSDYDLAGFCVGVVERDRIIDGTTVESGDLLIGLASSGPHANGYSLIRKVLERSDIDPAGTFGSSTLGKVLLKPTRIYVRPVLKLAAMLPVKALCHVTGGGITENLPRVLPAATRATIALRSWQRPAIFDWLQEQGGISEAEMYRTFNCGIGLIVCVAEQHADRALSVLREQGETPCVIGTVQASSGPAEVELVA
jgi:phosphoribosylformylglycinamidine cyclo-ligase